MSPVERDRIIQADSGRNIPGVALAARIGADRFTTAISVALREEYGGTHAAIKTVVGLTQANERAVKNWFQAKNGPNGEFLIALCRHSDRVLETVLSMAERSEILKAKRMSDARSKLAEMLRTLDEMSEP